MSISFNERKKHRTKIKQQVRVVSRPDPDGVFGDFTFYYEASHMKEMYEKVKHLVIEKIPNFNCNVRFYLWKLDVKHPNISRDEPPISSKKLIFHHQSTDKEAFFKKHFDVFKDIIHDQDPEQGSGWKFVKTLRLQMSIYRPSPRAGGSNFKLPVHLKGKGLINIDNKDEKCFMYCLLLGMHFNEITTNRQRVSKYEEHVSKYNWDNIEFPVKPIDLEYIEEEFNRNNERKIGFTVWGKRENDSDNPEIIYTSQTPDIEDEDIICLYYCFDGEKAHYLYVPRASSLFSKASNKARDRASLICLRCSNRSTTKKAYKDHKRDCDARNTNSVTVLPSKKTKIQFINERNTQNVPSFAVSDFESLLEKYSAYMNRLMEKLRSVEHDENMEKLMKDAEAYKQKEQETTDDWKKRVKDALTFEESSLARKKKTETNEEYKKRISDALTLRNKLVKEIKKFKLGKELAEQIQTVEENLEQLSAAALEKKIGTLKRQMNNVRKIAHHQPCGFFVIIIHNNKIYDYKLHRAESPDEDVGEKLLDWLVPRCNNLAHINLSMRNMTDEQKQQHSDQKSCKECKKNFTTSIRCEVENKDITDWKNHVYQQKCASCCKNKDKKNLLYKVRDHDHATGEYRQTICQRCNWKLKRAHFIPVLFHNLSNYDSHIIIKGLTRWAQTNEIAVIPLNKERYISFGIHFKNYDLRFLDSYKFMRSSLDQHVENLSRRAATDGFINSELDSILKNVMTPENYKILFEKMFYEDVKLDKLVKHLKSKFLDKEVKEWLERKSYDNFKITREFAESSTFYPSAEEFTNERRLELLVKKGVYPYDYMSSFDKFNESASLSQDQFYNTLNREHLSEEQYEHYLAVCKVFDIKTLGNLHDLYVTTDVLLLTDVIMNFRSINLKDFGLDPLWYYTLPGFALDSMLKMTKIVLDVVPTTDMHLFIEKSMYGGITLVARRYAKANNEMLEDFNPTKESSWILYVDMNSLYPTAMYEKLPVRNFEWLEEFNKDSIVKTIKKLNKQNKGCFLEVTLDYPDELHNKHRSLPYCFEKVKINGHEKLVGNLETKERYVLHHRNLLQVLEAGLELREVHRVLQFDEEAFMRPYIDKCVELRKNARNDFEVQHYKEMMNIVFGKTIENVRNRTDIKIVGTKKQKQNCVDNPRFKDAYCIDGSLYIAEMQKTECKLEKPIYIGCAVLGISKTLMYDYHYNVIKKVYGKRAKLLYMDTDSFFYWIQTSNVYKDIETIPELRERMDLSAFPHDHPLYDIKNKKQLGFMKDESPFVPIEEFAGVCPKTYAYTCGKKTVMKAKGFKKSETKKQLKMTQYVDVITGKIQSVVCDQNLIQSYKHEIFMTNSNKEVLNDKYDKVYVKGDRVSTLPWGHKHVRNKDILFLKKPADYYDTVYTSLPHHE